MLSGKKCAFVALLCGFISPAWAQITPPQEYARYVGRSSAVEAFADFGDQVNLRDGSLLIRVTDVELPGTGPTIRLTRTYRPNSLGKDLYENSGIALGAWEIEVPRIKTITSATNDGVHPYSPVGWQVAGTSEAEKNARCTRFSAPDRITHPYDAARAWNTWEWWNGYHLVDDGGNDQLVMTRTDASVRPDLALMTTGNWLVGCLSATTSGEPGEAFYALNPDGTKYWFNHLVYTDIDELQKPLWSNVPPMLRVGAATSSRRGISGPTPKIVADFDALRRRMGSMLVTRIEDRFGNWVTYHYTGGRLDSINASDGRRLEFSYGAPGNATVTVGSGSSARVWTYVYNTGGPLVTQQLTVTRPDGATWQYSLPALPASALNTEADPTAICTIYPDDYDLLAQGTIVSPAGATLTLTVDRKRFARSYVPKACWGGDPAQPEMGYAKYPREWYAFAVVSRSVSGPGIATATWSYVYAPPVSSWLQDCPTPTSCASTVWTDVTSPDGGRRRSIFSSKYDETENKLLREEDYAPSGQLLRAKDYAYATVSMANWTNNPYPWPVSVGNDQQTRQNPQTSGQWAPVRRAVITQQGRSFGWEVPFTCGGSGVAPCFDAYARPAKVVKSSASSP